VLGSKRLRAGAQALVREHRSPGKVAAAIVVGCTVGCTPLFGFHLPLCVALAWLLGLNQLIVYGAANVSNPLLATLIGFASVQLGERILHGRWMQIARADFTLARLPELARHFFVNWLAGGVALGAAVGAVGGAVAYVLLRRRPAAAPPDATTVAVMQARRRYDSAHPRFKWYARMKYVMDPCYRAIAQLVPEGSFTVDLGTGLGMLPVLLGELGGGRQALGVEWDVAKADCGAAACRGLDGVRVVADDLRNFALPACDVITLVDVLHYYDADAQRALLQRCRAALRDGGRLLVREGDAARRRGARWTRAVEAVVTRLGWNRGPKVRFRPIAELRDELAALGFTVDVAEVAGQLHPGNVLLVGKLG
jgi:uncharacterized protein (DUF2062 family)/SAM-dependent methyltransferase